MRTYREMFEESRKLAAEWSEVSRALAQSSDERASSFAQLVVQSLIILNGGALIALAQVSLKHSWLSVATVAAFIAGATSATAAGARGFRCLAVRTEGFHARADEATHRAWLHLFTMEKLENTDNPDAIAYLDQQIKVAEQLADEKDGEAEKSDSQFIKVQRQGVFLAWSSLGLFVAGSCLGIWLTLGPDGFSLKNVQKSEAAIDKAGAGVHPPAATPSTIVNP